VHPHLLRQQLAIICVDKTRTGGKHAHFVLDDSEKTRTIDAPETQATTTSTDTSMDPKATDRQPIDRVARLDSNTEKQCATPTYTDSTPTDSTLTMMASTLSTTTIGNTLATNKTLNTTTSNLIDTANTWRQLNPTADSRQQKIPRNGIHIRPTTHQLATRCNHYLVVRILVCKNRGTFELLNHKTRQTTPKQN
jgi:hypothetical protein